ncbi:MAG: hypothetical protein ACI4LI_06520 [Candidatus Fimenecus sp.]
MKKFLFNSIFAGWLWSFLNFLFLILCVATGDKYGEMLFWYSSYAEVDGNMFIKYICIFAIPAVLAAVGCFFFGYKVLQPLGSHTLNLFSLFPLHLLMTGAVYLTSLSMFSIVGFINWPIAFLKTASELYAVMQGTYMDFDASPIRSFAEWNYYDFGVNFLLTLIPYFLMFFGLCLRTHKVKKDNTPSV